MSPLRWLWLALAIWGALHPWALLGQGLAEGENGIAELWARFGADAISRGIGWEVIICGASLILFALAETLVRKNWEALLAIPATLLLGPACGLPLYLFLRAAPIR